MVSEDNSLVALQVALHILQTRGGLVGLGNDAASSLPGDRQCTLVNDHIASNGRIILIREIIATNPAEQRQHCME